MEGESSAVKLTAPPAAATDAETTSTASKRLSNTTACLPIVYGSVAFYLGKKADEYQTHEWTLYVRGPNSEDLSSVISKVVFQLHPSFQQPVRELTTPPFEVTERGWGEFDSQIKIIWKDPTEKPIVVSLQLSLFSLQIFLFTRFNSFVELVLLFSQLEVTHGIKLYPPGTPANVVPTNKEPVLEEHYDEVVFTDPTEGFYRQLMRISSVPSVTSNLEQVQAAFGQFTDEEVFQTLLESQKFLQTDLLAVKERLKLIMSETDEVDEALRQVQDQRKTTATQARNAKQKGQTAGPPPQKKAKVAS